METLQNYLGEQTLRKVRESFSAVAGRAVDIYAPDGLTPLAHPAGTQPGQPRRGRKEPILLDEPVMLAGGVAGRVRMLAPTGRAAARSAATGTFHANLLRLMAGVLGQLCEGSIQLRNRIEQLLALHRITAEITGVRDLQQVMDSVTQIVVEAMKVKACSIRLLSGDGKELVIRAVHSISPQYLDKRPIPLSESELDQEVLRTNEPVYIEDMTTDPRVLYPAESRREGLISGLCAPMVFQDRREGVLRAFTGERHEFDWFDRQLLQTIANSAAAAIANARLYSEAAQSWQIKRQLAMASEVQRRMIPKSAPSIEGFDMHAAYIPSQELAGDFYDFVHLPEGNLGIAICDVVGKGVRASLLMASIRASLRAHAVNVYEMSDVLAHVNRDLCSDTLSSDFATMFYAVLNTDTKELTYSCAGHPGPLLVRNGTVQYLETHGGVLGILPEMEFPLGQVQLDAGDVVLAYTDGLSEAMNFKHEQYGQERIAEALLYAVTQGYSAHDIVRHCLWDLRRFAGLHRRRDDRTLIAIKTM